MDPLYGALTITRIDEYILGVILILVPIAHPALPRLDGHQRILLHFLIKI